MNEMDVNDFYMIEYVCSACGNICGKADQICPVCGEGTVVKETVCRSSLEYWHCTGVDCAFATHEETPVCPSCGMKTKASAYLIPEDHWGIGIPEVSECVGLLRDDGEGLEIAGRLAVYAKR